MSPPRTPQLQSIDIEVELAKAGANTKGRGGELRFLAGRYVLGTIGLVIMATFVLAALFATWLYAVAAGAYLALTAISYLERR